MGKNSTCTVPDCKTGYRSNKNKETNSKIALHGFPTNIDMINKWKKAIPRTWEQDGKTLNIKNAVVCSLHFTNNDYRHQSLTNDQPLKLRLLKKDAIPSQFPGPSYFSKKPIKCRKTKATNRRKSENQKINHMNQELINSDKVYTLDDLKEKIKKYTIPSNALFISEDTSLTYFLIDKPSLGPPTIVFSLVIDSNLTFEMYQEKKLLPLSVVSHIVPSKKIHTCSEVLKILATLKGLETNSNHDPIKYIKKQVEAILNILSEVEDIA